MSDYVMEYWVEPMATIELVLENYVELSPYQILFEADKPDVSQQMRQNANLEQQGDSAIMKIIKGITGLISRIIQTITDFFAKLFMNGDEKRAFDEMQQKINENPNIKNKKLTIKDFKRLNAEFNELSAQAKREADAIHNGKMQTPTTELMNKMQSYIDGGVKPGSAIVFTTMAVNIARSDAGMAKTIYSLLGDESRALKSLEAALGKKEAGKFKKEMAMYAAEISIRRKLVNMGGKHYNSIQECIQDTVFEINNLFHGKLSFTNVKMLLRFVKNKEARQAIVKPAVKSAIKGKKNEVHAKIYNAMGGETRSNDRLGFITDGQVTDQQVKDKIEGTVKKVKNKIFGSKDEDQQQKNTN